MTTAQWALVIGAVFGPGGLVLAAAGWLRASSAHRRITTHLDYWHGPGATPAPAPRPPHSAL